MTAARRTDGWGPTTNANPITTTIATIAASRRPTRARLHSAQTAAASSATLKPETASTWYTPARRKAPSMSGGRPVRSPSSRPPSNAADAGGSACPMAATAWRFTRAGHGGGGSSSGVIDSARTVAITRIPSRARYSP